METLLQSLAMKYGMEKAIQLLGIDKQQGNPKYAINLGGRSINPMNMLKRAGLNQGMKGIMGGGKLGGMLGPGLLLGGALGLGYLTNPLREGSYNYNPNLRGQIDYASGKGYIGTNPNSGLMQYGPESVLRGQNVVSGFGTNDYRGQLGKKQSYFEDRINKGKNYSQTQYEKTLNEIKEYEQDQVNKELAEEEKARNQITKNLMTQNNAYTGGGGGGFDTSAADRAGTSAGSGQFSPSTSRGRSGYIKGGIASL